MTISIAASHAAQPVGLVMVRKTVELASIALYELLAHHPLCVILGLVELMALIIAVVQWSIGSCLEVLRKSL